VSPLAGTIPLLGSGPGRVTGGLMTVVAFGALASFGNGAITVGLAALVSEGATGDAQGAALSVTRGAGSLGRTVEPPLAAAAYVVVYWSPFVAGTLLLVPVALLLPHGERRVLSGANERLISVGTVLFARQVRVEQSLNQQSRNSLRT
jgi:MFS family permease